jgi:hypothetical protein
MRYVYALVFFTLIQSTYGQDVQQAVKPERLKNFYVGPSIGIEFMNIKKYDAGHNGYSVAYKGVPSVRLGVDLTYKQTKNLVINAGLFYSNKNFERTEICEECATDYYYKSRYINRYYEILGGATYNFIVGRLDMGVYTNLNFSFLHVAKEIRETETGNSFTFNTKAAQNKILTVIEPGFNVNYNMTYRLSLNIRAGYRLYTNSLNNAKTYTNSGILLQPGLFYMF